MTKEHQRSTWSKNWKPLKVNAWIYQFFPLFQWSFFNATVQFSSVNIVSSKRLIFQLWIKQKLVLSSFCTFKHDKTSETMINWSQIKPSNSGPESIMARNLQNSMIFQEKTINSKKLLDLKQSKTVILDRFRTKIAKFFSNEIDWFIPFCSFSYNEKKETKEKKRQRKQNKKKSKVKKKEKEQKEKKNPSQNYQKSIWNHESTRNSFDIALNRPNAFGHFHNTSNGIHWMDVIYSLAHSVCHLMAIILDFYDIEVILHSKSSCDMM